MYVYNVPQLVGCLTRPWCDRLDSTRIGKVWKKDWGSWLDFWGCRNIMVGGMWTDVDKKWKMKNKTDKKESLLWLVPLGPYLSTVIMLKLEIIGENAREEPKVNFTFTEGSETPRLGVGWMGIKPVPPSDIDRDWEKGHAFLNTCCIHFSVCRDLFEGDQACIHWAFSFFKSDQATYFSSKVMHLEQQTGKWHYKDWCTFEREFKELFCTNNEQLAVLTKLEGTS